MQQASAESLRLRAVAERYAPRVLASGASAVAATGSVGRGDAEPGSDLDLWVIAQHEGTAHDVFEGVPITLLVGAEAQMLDAEYLCGIEVELAHVICDPRGLFARVRAELARNGGAIRAMNLERAYEELGELLSAAQDGTPQGRLWMLRAAAHLAASIRMYLDTGLMMPKMRHLRARLAPRAYDLVREIQGIDDVAPHVTELIAASVGIADRMNAQLAALGRSEQPISVPHTARLKLEHGSHEDGIMLMRSFFDRSFVEQVVIACPEISTVDLLLGSPDRELRDFWQKLYGLDDTDARLEQKVASCAVAVRALLDEIAIEIEIAIDGRPLDGSG